LYYSIGTAVIGLFILASVIPMPQEVSASELTFNLGMSNAVIDLTKNGTSQLTVHQKVAATNKCLSSDFWCCIENIKPCIPRARIISVIDGEGKTLLFNGTTGSNQLMITFGSFSSVGTIGAIGFE